MTVCSGSLEHVELALLEGSELSSAVQAHLSTCSSCAAQAETLKGIVAALQASPAPEAPAGLAARLVPLVLAEAQSGRRMGVLARVLRPLTAAATSFVVVLGILAGSGIALITYAQMTKSDAANPTPEAPASEAPATVKTPSTQAPASQEPATESPATEVPAAPATPAPTPTPTPELPRRTPEPVSPDPSEGESTAPAESTSP
jgi:anti-sigma factor RsiW